MSDDLKTKVQELIDSMINPAVAGHGGFVDLIDVKDNKVYLTMGGGCQGCGAADVTLKSGIERLIKEELPEIEEVLDTTDHASGSNPYYQPASKLPRRLSGGAGERCRPRPIVLPLSATSGRRRRSRRRAPTARRRTWRAAPARWARGPSGSC